jgi:hypothetical protein
MRTLGDAARGDGDCCLTGGAAARAHRLARAATLEVDLRLEPEQDELLRAFPTVNDEPSRALNSLTEPGRCCDPRLPFVSRRLGTTRRERKR